MTSFWTTVNVFVFATSLAGVLIGVFLVIDACRPSWYDFRERFVEILKGAAIAFVSLWVHFTVYGSIYGIK